MIDNMIIGDEEYKRKLQEHLEARKPDSFNSMTDSMSWYAIERKKFIEELEEILQEEKDSILEKEMQRELNK
jgi:bifunctional pyridoxal-dependent enzyme with beta-cystathionase and maltose regulon repressor activities